MRSTAGRVAVILIAAVAVWKLPSGGTAARVVWEALGVIMLASIAWAAWRFGRDHWLDLDRLGESGRLVLFGSLGLFAVAMAGRPVLWSTAPGSLLWILMIAAVVGGGIRSWHLWKEL
jgi:hypothetical protein